MVVGMGAVSGAVVELGTVGGLLLAEDCCACAASRRRFSLLNIVILTISSW